MSSSVRLDVSLFINQICSRPKLTSNRIVESLLRKMAGLVGGVQDLVVEHGEVKGKTETDGVRGRKLGLSNLGGSLVGLKGLVGRLLSSVTNGELGEITVVVTLPISIISTS